MKIAARLGWSVIPSPCGMVPRFTRNDTGTMNEARHRASNCSSGKMTSRFAALN
jgi:hypothetical protein